MDEILTVVVADHKNVKTVYDCVYLGSVDDQNFSKLMNRREALSKLFWQPPFTFKEVIKFDTEGHPRATFRIKGEDSQGNLLMTAKIEEVSISIREGFVLLKDYAGKTTTVSLQENKP